MNRCFVVFFAGLFLTAFSAAAGNESVSAGDDVVPAGTRFGSAYEALTMADNARDSGDIDHAVRLYSRAFTLYVKLAREYPDWQPGMTRFRIAYCDSQLKTLVRRLDEAAVPDAVGRDTGGGTEKSAARSVKLGEPAMSDLGALRKEARRHINEGEDDKARALLLRGMANDPDDRDLRFLMGVVQCHAGKYADAVSILESLVREGGASAHVRVALGAGYFGLGDIAKSIEEMERAIGLDPDMAEAYHDLAQILVRRDPVDMVRLREVYDRALSLGAARDRGIESVLESSPLEPDGFEPAAHRK